MRMTEWKKIRFSSSSSSKQKKMKKMTQTVDTLDFWNFINQFENWVDNYLFSGTDFQWKFEWQTIKLAHLGIVNEKLILLENGKRLNGGMGDGKFMHNIKRLNNFYWRTTMFDVEQFSIGSI